MRRLLVVLALALGCLLPSSASASVFVDLSVLKSPANGMVIGPDGNFWVSEEFSGTVARISPTGTVLQRYELEPNPDGDFDNGSLPIGVANGPGGRVWVAAEGANKLVWFDATSPTPTMHDIPTGSGCGPVAIVSGGDDRMYFSMPSPDGTCNGGVGTLGSVAADGTGPVATGGGGGDVFDLEVSGGKLFAPDFDNNSVRRITLGTSFTTEATIEMPTPDAGPDGIAADGAGNLYVTEWFSGKIARFRADQQGGEATEFTPTGGTLTNPFGILVGTDGRIYVAGKGSRNLMRMNPDGTGFAFYPLEDSEPFNLINGFDQDIWFTDQSKTRIVRFVNSAPRAATGRVRSTGPTSGSVRAAVNSRGNATQVVFDYGKTTKYGKSTKPLNLPAAVDPADVVGVMTRLKSETRYHVRARAINGEGTVVGEDQTFKTPPFPELATSTSIRVVLRGRGVVVQQISILRLRGTETATIRCKGRGCPFKRKAVRLKRRTKTFGAKLLRGRRLRPGMRVSVVVTAPRTIGTFTTLVVGRKAPKIKRACIRPGEKKPSRCP